MEDHLNLYYIFHVVAEARSISQAGKKLFISQPAISKAIQRLENRMGIQLFVRTSRGVHLTEAGQLLYTHVEAAFEKIQTGERLLIRHRMGSKTRLRIGASTTLCRYVLLPYLKQYTEANPQVSITIQCQPSGETLRFLEEGRIDVGLIGTDKPDRIERFTCLGNIHDTFVAAPSYLDELDPDHLLSAEELLEAGSLMLLDGQNMTRKYVNDYLDACRIKGHQQLVVTSMDLLIEFARIGLGIGCVIREFVRQDLDRELLKELIPSKQINPRKIGFVSASVLDCPEEADRFIAQWKLFDLNLTV